MTTTIPSGAPVVTIPAGSPIFHPYIGVNVIVVGEVDIMEPAASVIKIAQQDTDGSYKLMIQIPITGIQQNDPGTTLATVFNYSSVAQRTSWTATDALTLAATMAPSALEPLVRSWMMGVLAPQIAAELTTLYPAAAAPPSGGGTTVTGTTGLLDLVKQFLLGLTYSRDSSGNVIVGHT